jgi:hypothetical protein
MPDGRDFDRPLSLRQRPFVRRLRHGPQSRPQALGDTETTAGVNV